MEVFVVDGRRSDAGPFGEALWYRSVYIYSIYIYKGADCYDNDDNFDKKCTCKTLFLFLAEAAEQSESTSVCVCVW